METEFTRVRLRALVDDFYEGIRADDLLGPVFAARVEDWPAHLETMTRFWGTVLTHRAGYKGSPMQVHGSLPGIGSHHFDRWIVLFEETVPRHFDGEAARTILARAHAMRSNLERAILHHRFGPTLRVRSSA